MNRLKNSEALTDKQLHYFHFTTSALLLGLTDHHPFNHKIIQLYTVPMRFDKMEIKDILSLQKYGESSKRSIFLDISMHIAILNGNGFALIM